jgi:hypothetical protein
VPLRALIDGVDCISVAMNVDEWQRLRTRLRSSAQAAVLPCCGVRAVPKTSHLGTQFFAHYKRVKCVFATETEQHRMIKQALLRGCRDAGWCAQLEHSAADGSWRADVLATRGERAVAFEIQWTKQSAQETARRQRIYEVANVRGCWLFRSLPRMSEHRDIPAFGLSIGQRATLPTVKLNSKTIAIEEFAATMLSGGCKFRPQLTIVSPYYASVHLRQTVCPACRSVAHFADVELPQPISACGRSIVKLPSWLDSAMREFAARFRRFDPVELQELALPLDAQTRAASLVLPSMPGAPYMSAAGRSGFCSKAGCRSIVPWVECDPPPIAKTFALPLSHCWPNLAEPHWCFGGLGAFCSASTRRTSARDDT